MITKIVQTLKAITCVVLITQLVGCGTIMYPARRGQRGGKIDAGVAVLDGVGLLLFLVPGVIAFAVDFSTGAIYLPGRSRSSLDLKNMKVVKFDKKNCTNESLEKIIKQETGLEVKLNQDNIQVTRLGSTDEMEMNSAGSFCICKN